MVRWAAGTGVRFRLLVAGAGRRAGTDQVMQDAVNALDSGLLQYSADGSRGNIDDIRAMPIETPTGERIFWTRSPTWRSTPPPTMSTTRTQSERATSRQTCRATTSARWPARSKTASRRSPSRRNTTSRYRRVRRTTSRVRPARVAGRDRRCGGIAARNGIMPISHSNISRRPKPNPSVPRSVAANDSRPS